jgi:hypothetical protein
MSAQTRRTILKKGLMATGAMLLPSIAVGRELAQRCPECGADLAMGDLHKAGCKAGGIAAPVDHDVNPAEMKVAEKTAAQKTSRDCPSQNPATDPCIGPDCDRCKVQMTAKAEKRSKRGICYHKNKCGCAVYTAC